MTLSARRCWIVECGDEHPERPALHHMVDADLQRFVPSHMCAAPVSSSHWFTARWSAWTAAGSRAGARAFAGSTRASASGSAPGLRTAAPAGTGLAMPPVVGRSARVGRRSPAMAREARDSRRASGVGRPGRRASALSGPLDSDAMRWFLTAPRSVARWRATARDTPPRWRVLHAMRIPAQGPIGGRWGLFGGSWAQSWSSKVTTIFSAALGVRARRKAWPTSVKGTRWLMSLAKRSWCSARSGVTSKISVG